MRTYKDLHQYQKETIKKIIEKKRLALWLQMSLGKTVITLTAIQQIKPKKTLIIAPLNVAKNVWHTEASKWEHLKNLKFSFILGSKQQRLDALSSKADIYIINRENIVWLVEGYFKLWDFDMIVIDESSSFKSYSSKRFKALKKVSQLSPYHIQLTGTPSPNGLIDIWTQIYLIDGGKRLLSYITRYRDLYFNVDYSGFKYIAKPTALYEISKKIQDIVIKIDLKDVSLQVPKVNYNKLEIDLPPKILKQYKEFKKNQVLELIDDDDEVTAFNATALINKLSQFANGFVYTEDNKVIDIHDSKLKALQDLIEDNPNENMLIAYKYKADIDKLLSIKGSELLSGDSEQIKRWNNGKIKYLIAHALSAGHGLNLQFGGSIIVWYGMNYSLELTQQFNARLIRQGVDKPVRIFSMLCKSTIDELIYSQINTKDITQKELLNSIVNNLIN